MVRKWEKSFVCLVVSMFMMSWFCLGLVDMFFSVMHSLVRAVI